MADPSLVLDLLKQVLKIVKMGQEHRSTAQDLRSAMEELVPVVEQINEYAETMDLPAEESRKLKEVLEATQEAVRKYSEIGWSNFILAPYYLKKLEAAEKSLDKYISRQLQLQMARDLKDLRSKPTVSAETTEDQIGASAFGMRSDREKVSRFVVGLSDNPLMKQLKLELIKDGGDQVLNLTGFSGMGKTTLAKELCHDVQVRGKFNDNILFVHQPNINQLQDKLDENGSRPVFLALDDVPPGSQGLIEQIRDQISSNSKILLISRVAFTNFGTPYRMMPLEKSDARTLFCHYALPSVGSSSNIPDEGILEKVVEGCGGLPFALKFIGSELQGKPIEYWQKLLQEWSQQGHSVLDYNSNFSKLLTHLQKSLRVLEEYKSIREFFNDLALFPKGKMIPVTALFDVWIELYKQDEEGIDAAIFVHQLASMNLVVIEVERNVGSDADNYYNYHFLTQHDLLKELAIHSNSQDSFEKRKRLIIVINGGNPPKWWPQQPQQGINARIPSLIRPKKQRVAARILSISLSTDQKITPDRCNIKAVEAEVLILNIENEEYKFPKFIKKMGKLLKVLIVTNYGCHLTVLKSFKLLSSLWNLKRIRLQQVSVPFLCKLKNLRKLSLFECEVKQAFENSSTPISKAMRNLVELNIDNCKDMVELPADLCHITTLEKLSISGCRRFIVLPQEIGKLENLKSLRVSYCADFEKIPESITELKRLSFLDISYCASLREVPDDFGNLSNLSKLYVMGSSIREFPNSVMNMEHLDCVKCDEVTYDFWEAIQHIRPSLTVKKEGILP